MAKLKRPAFKIGKTDIYPRKSSGATMWASRRIYSPPKVAPPVVRAIQRRANALFAHEAGDREARRQRWYAPKGSSLRTSTARTLHRMRKSGAFKKKKLTVVKR